jgi:hypothetical protein
LIGADVAFEAFLTAACRATFAIKRFSPAMRLPISESSFGRICGGLTIRNDLLTFPTETPWDFDGATVAFVVCDKTYAAGWPISLYLS